MRPSESAPPEIVEISGASVRLRWKKPDYDGGSPICGYRVWYKALVDDATPVLADPKILDEESMVVRGLQYEVPYVFRINAINGKGFRSWSLRSEEIKCKRSTDALE